MAVLFGLGEPMKYVIVYWSRFGNNKKIVDALEPLLKKKGDVQVFKAIEVNSAKMPDADYYIFSAAVEALMIQLDMKILMKNIEDLDGKKYGIINTYKNRNKLKKMEKLLNKKKMIKIAEVDFAMGENFKAGKGLQTGWEGKLQEFAGKL